MTRTRNILKIICMKFTVKLEVHCLQTYHILSYITQNQFAEPWIIMIKTIAITLVQFKSKTSLFCITKIRHLWHKHLVLHFTALAHIQVKNTSIFKNEEKKHQWCNDSVESFFSIEVMEVIFFATTRKISVIVKCLVEDKIHQKKATAKAQRCIWVLVNCHYQLRILLPKICPSHIIWEIPIEKRTTSYCAMGWNWIHTWKNKQHIVQRDWTLLLLHAPDFLPIIYFLRTPYLWHFLTI